MISRPWSQYGRVAATLAVATSLGVACGKVTSSDSGANTHPGGDAGPDGATGGAPGAGGSVVSGGTAGSGAGPAGAGPVGGGPPGIGGAYVPDGAVCTDLTRTLPTSCVQPLCDCAGLAGCDLKCWIDVACIRQRCAGTADLNCANDCGPAG